MSARPLHKLAPLILILAYADYGFQFLYQMVVSRLLTVEDYGVYSALASIATVFMLFSSTFPLVALRNISRAATENPADIWPCLESTLRRLSLTLLPFGLCVYFAAPLIQSFFHLDSASPLFLAITVFILGCYLNTLLAALQAVRLYLHTTALTLAFTVLRIVLGISLVYFLELRFLGIFYGLLIAHVIVLLFVYLQLRKHVSRPALTQPYKISFEGWQNAILISVGMGVLIGLDTSLARHYLEPLEAGIYSAASTTAKIVMMLSAPFVNWLVPEVTRARALTNTSGHSYSVKQLILLTAGISLLGWIVISTVPSLVLAILVGQKYLAAAEVVPVLAGATLCLANVSIMNQYCFAHGFRGYFYFLYGAALIGIGSIVLHFHQSALQLAYGVLLSAGLALIAGLASIFYYKSRTLAPEGALAPKVG